MSNLVEVIDRIQAFRTDSLKSRISDLESLFSGADSQSSKALINSLPIEQRLLEDAFQIKTISGQINVIIHALGILLSLPDILETDEEVQSLSLGAGNTGREFDLETNRRVAEYKFIQWRGGPETIRQNSLFKDFFYLAEHKTQKAKYLYVLETERPLKFLTGNRALSSVLSRNAKLAKSFHEKYNDSYLHVKDYYAAKRDTVAIIDLGEISEIFRGYGFPL